jgi:hypothetical protein
MSMKGRNSLKGMREAVDTLATLASQPLHSLGERDLRITHGSIGLVRRYAENRHAGRYVQPLTPEVVTLSLSPSSY